LCHELSLLCINLFFFFFFFFSSRRRHTRSYGDWSSDVCSSDLGRKRRAPAVARDDGVFAFGDDSGKARHAEEMESRADSRRVARSEERRVGKECRSRWSADDSKKKYEG